MRRHSYRRLSARDGAMDGGGGGDQRGGSAVSEAKQIEEMAETLDEMCDLDLLADCGEKDCSKCMATALYNAGYRKQSEGEWVDQYHGEYANQLYKCSVCGETAYGDGYRWFLSQYCPNCGARMGGGAE